MDPSIRCSTSGRIVLASSFRALATPKSDRARGGSADVRSSTSALDTPEDTTSMPCVGGSSPCPPCRPLVRLPTTLRRPDVKEPSRFGLASSRTHQDWAAPRATRDAGRRANRRIDESLCGPRSRRAVKHAPLGQSLGAAEAGVGPPLEPLSAPRPLARSGVSVVGGIRGSKPGQKVHIKEDRIGPDARRPPVFSRG